MKLFLLFFSIFFSYSIFIGASPAKAENTIKNMTTSNDMIKEGLFCDGGVLFNTSGKIIHNFN